MKQNLSKNYQGFNQKTKQLQFFLFHFDFRSQNKNIAIVKIQSIGIQDSKKFHLAVPLDRHQTHKWFGTSASSMPSSRKQSIL